MRRWQVASSIGRTIKHCHNPTFTVVNRLSRRTMATASKIKLSPSHRPVFGVANLQQDSADKASELLQENHDKHHIYFNEDGFHNHIAHHLLSIYALGASPSEIDKAYNENQSYQIPPPPKDDRVFENLKDDKTFGKYLGQRKRYSDYLRFFKEEIELKGWQTVVHEYLFARTDKAEDMLCRLYAGFLHPIIHLGFGIEFDQPAIIAEALAQTATHDTWIGKFLQPAEEYAKTYGVPSKSLIDLLHEAQASQELVNSIRDEDGNKLRDGVIARAGDAMAKLAAQYVVSPNELATRCAEMMEFCAYDTVTAQRPNKQIRFDFFFMHDANCAIFFPYFLSNPAMDWLSAEDKARLLEWKGRTDIAQYVARGSPKLYLEEIDSYVPKKGNGTSNGANGHQNEWDGIFQRACVLSDDGHASKLIRALAATEQACADGKFKNGIIKEHMWPKTGHMVMDSVEVANPRWLRSVGMDSAWESVPARSKGNAAL